MTTLITGATGFVGLNLLEALLERGEDVVAFDSGVLPSHATHVFERYGHQLTLERGSVLEAQNVRALFGQRAIDSVIHAAAITSGAEREARDPASIVDVNLRGTINVLEAAHEYGVRRVVYVGSGAAYGESLYRLPWLYEETPSLPTTLYSITKHAAERLCLRLRELWNEDVLCVRLGTVIGPWERDTGVRDNFGTHSQLAKLAAAGQQALLPAREIQRDWIYARDVARGIIALADSKRLDESVYNLSSGVVWPHPVTAWCEALKRRYQRFSYGTADENGQPNIWYTDRDRGVMDIGRLERATGFRIMYPMREAYENYLDWMERTPEFFR